MTASNAENLRCTYLLPIRRVNACREEAADFAEYFRKLARTGCEVLVIDGSRRAQEERGSQARACNEAGHADEVGGWRWETC